MKPGTCGRRFIAWLGVMLAGASCEAAAVNKTIRVEHGRPIIIVSERTVLLFEFIHDPTNALVAHDDAALRHCRAHYRYRVFDGATGSVTNGSGMVEEILRTVLVTATGREVRDAGSRTRFEAGEFAMSWSEGQAGVRSWLYYRADSNIRFIQQPQQVRFDAVDAGTFRRYLAARNVEQFVTAGRSVQVIGPAVFSGDLPLENPASGRIESCRVRDGAIELKLGGLEVNKSYVIDSSYEVTGNWTAVHSFIARESSLQWTDPLGKDVTTAFYRIRQAPY